ncbi:sensor histidine kinase [Micromonospora sp. NBC_01813]|uniref:sensor histidine kinase n=1 Tax=Micromonospora sp. NBC_01813 TaxID=2975988 RepID=UPI002DDC8685|nr:HAMP domain-containing sensor histidine kinase [Micromonospora sp. NBC_01813]WSA06710.1 HAMP domain-containing histidine kinase [Micromonospora sp. NBC_01813]
MTRRLVASYVGVALVVLLLLEIPLGYLYGLSEHRRVETELEHSAEVLAAFVDETVREDAHPAGGPGHGDRLRLLAVETAGQVGGRVDIVDRTGVLLASSDPAAAAGTALGDLPEIRTALRSDRHVGIRTGDVDGVESLSVAVPVQPAAIRGAVRLTVPVAPVRNGIIVVWSWLAAAGAGVLVIVTLLAFALARWIVRPVRALEGATRQLADGTLTAPPVRHAGPPELHRLTVTFHQAAGRVQRLLDAQRSFAGHASHQLKTPLAALRLRLENLEDEVPPAARSGFTAALAETDRLAQMVDTLLALARSEQVPAKPQPIDCDRVVADRVSLWEPLMRQRGVKLRVTGGPVGTVRAVDGAVDQMLENLLANALCVAPSGSTITVDRSVAPPPLDSGDGEQLTVPQGVEQLTVLRVVDEGPGLTDEQRSRAFDPFWRAAGAPKGGTGLGLTLVRRLAEASGGRVELRPGPGGLGLDAVITLQRPKVDSPAADVGSLAPLSSR